MSRAAGWLRSAALSSRTLRWLLWVNHTGTTTFIQRLSFWWRWESYGLSILSSGLLALNTQCFPLSFLWSILLSVAISLQGGKVVRGLAQHAASCPCRWFKAEHISLIQIHDHISFMALQLWVRCFLSAATFCQMSPCMHAHAPTKRHRQALGALSHAHECSCRQRHCRRGQSDKQATRMTCAVTCSNADAGKTGTLEDTSSPQSNTRAELPSSHADQWGEGKWCMYLSDNVRLCGLVW